MTRAETGGDLEQAFRAPPEATKPRCYWYWIDGQISKEGVTHDLEAMRRFGIGVRTAQAILEAAACGAGGTADETH